jgi:hypothetical protein
MKSVLTKIAVSFVLLMTLTFVIQGTALAQSSTRTATTITSQAEAPSVTCYGQAFAFGPFSLDANSVYLYPSQAPWFVTTGNCQDININFSELTHPIQMQVCFIRTGTCNSWKTVSQTGTWYQIATSVLAGTTYRFGIKTGASATTIKGQIAD